MVAMHELSVTVPRGRKFALEWPASRITDCGVYIDNVALLKVRAAPLAGQYAVHGNVYEFAKRDIGKIALISYELKVKDWIP